MWPLSLAATALRMRHHALARELVECDRVPVRGVVRRTAILRNRLLERLLEIEGGKQVARLAIRPRAVRRRPELEIPVEHVAVGIDAGLGLYHHRRAVRFPLMLLGSGVLELHRLSRHRRGQKRRVGRRVVGQVVSVAARARNMDAMHLDLVDAEEFGKAWHTLRAKCTTT